MSKCIKRLTHQYLNPIEFWRLPTLKNKKGQKPYKPYFFNILSLQETKRFWDKETDIDSNVVKKIIQMVGYFFYELLFSNLYKITIGNYYIFLKNRDIEDFNDEIKKNIRSKYFIFKHCFKATLKTIFLVSAFLYLSGQIGAGMTNVSIYIKENYKDYSYISSIFLRIGSFFEGIEKEGKSFLYKAWDFVISLRPNFLSFNISSILSKIPNPIDTLYGKLSSYKLFQLGSKITGAIFFVYDWILYYPVYYGGYVIWISSKFLVSRIFSSLVSGNSKPDIAEEKATPTYNTSASNIGNSNSSSWLPNWFSTWLSVSNVNISASRLGIKATGNEMLKPMVNTTTTGNATSYWFFNNSYIRF